MGDKQLALKTIFPSSCGVSNGKRKVEPFKFAIETWNLSCPEPLRGQVLTIGGLQKTMTDVLVRTQWLDGTKNTSLLAADNPELTFEKKTGAAGVIKAYFKLGAQHILSGVDHLMFVVAVMLLIVGRKQLVYAVTAFTLGHSITLALASTGIVQLQPSVVEPLIAMSIVLMAYEAVRRWRGQTGFTIEHPWLVTFSFGLLHGFGFAGALRAIGIPEGDFVLALLFFNVGIEVGQLLFIGTILLLMFLFIRKFVRNPKNLSVSVAYIIGSIAVYWSIERSMFVWL
jgi:hydrogenase/urease accessory protein HupE